MKLKGFTLAEVLITLGIIGVVAAVTLPSLQVNVNKRALGTQISKTYTQLQEGLKLYMINNNLDELSSSDLDLTAFAKNYLQVQYVCKDSEDTNCFADSYTTISSTSTTKTRKSIMNVRGAEAYILKDGTTIAFIPESNLTIVPPNASAYILASSLPPISTGRFDGDISMDDITNGRGPTVDIDDLTPIVTKSSVIVDVNGKKSPNKIGYDLFQMDINSDGSVGPSKTSVFTEPEKRDAAIATGLANCKTGKDFGGGCFTHLLRNNFQFDY